MSGPVAIDARAAARPELGGVERWARELSARLPVLRPGGYVVCRPPAALSHRLGHGWEQAVLPVRAAGHRARLTLCPANLAPLAGRHNVVVIHDAAALNTPGWYSPAYAALQARLLPAIARRAAHLVTVSEFSKAELGALLGVPADKVTVIGGGVGEAFTPDADAAAARAALGLDRPYVLCVASATARKNLGALTLAAQTLKTHGVDIVIAGGGRPQLAAEHDLDALRLLGHVPDAHLPGLYAGAEAFVLPSRHEGFGLTALEAMACGTPVVAARAGALPETCGDAAILTEPEPEPLRDALTTLLDDAAERERLRTAGLARARTRTWEQTTHDVDALLQHL